MDGVAAAHSLAISGFWLNIHRAWALLVNGMWPVYTDPYRQRKHRTWY
jgi:hypothetical protein